MAEKETVRHGLTDPETWVDQHADILFRFAILRLRDRQVAEELVQETFLAALKAKDRFQGQASERTWLVQILRNKIVDYYRKRRRERPVSELTEEPGLEEQYFDEKGRWRERPRPGGPAAEEIVRQQEFTRALLACLDELPERQGEAFRLRVIEGLSTDEVAEILDVTKTNLGVLLHRARLRLRTCLEAGWLNEGKDGHGKRAEGA